MVWKERTAEEKTIELEKIGKVIEAFWEVIDVDEVEKVYRFFLFHRNHWFTLDDTKRLIYWYSRLDLDVEWMGFEALESELENSKQFENYPTTNKLWLLAIIGKKYLETKAFKS